MPLRLILLTAGLLAGFLLVAPGETVVDCGTSPPDGYAWQARGLEEEEYIEGMIFTSGDWEIDFLIDRDAQDWYDQFECAEWLCPFGEDPSLQCKMSFFIDESQMEYGPWSQPTNDGYRSRTWSYDGLVWIKCSSCIGH